MRVLSYTSKITGRTYVRLGHTSMFMLRVIQQMEDAYAVPEYIFLDSIDSWEKIY